MNSISRFVWVSVAAASLSLSMVACGGSTTSPSTEDSSDDALTAAGKAYVGVYAAEQNTLGFRSLELKSDGSYSASRSAVCTAGEMCSQAIVLEKGRFSVKASNSLEPDHITLRPTGGDSHSYGIGHRLGASQAKGGITLVDGNVTEELDFSTDNTDDGSGNQPGQLSDEAKSFEGDFVAEVNTLGFRGLTLSEDGTYVAHMQAVCTGAACSQAIRLEKGAWDVKAPSGTATADDVITFTPSSGSSSSYDIEHRRGAGRGIASGIALIKNGTTEVLQDAAHTVGN